MRLNTSVNQLNNLKETVLMFKKPYFSDVKHPLYPFTFFRLILGHVFLSCMKHEYDKKTS